jgi:hypothetical protein
MSFEDGLAQIAVAQGTQEDFFIIGDDQTLFTTLVQFFHGLADGYVGMDGDVFHKS